MNRNTAVLVAVLTGLVIIGSCLFALANNGGEPRESTYSEGSVTVTTTEADHAITQTFDRVPERILVGDGSSLEMVLSLGLGDRVVGVCNDRGSVSSDLKDEYDALKARLDPSCFFEGPVTSYEVEELNPDFFLGYESGFMSFSRGVGASESLNDLGCNVMSLSTQSSSSGSDGLRSDYDNLGMIFDIKDRTDAFLGTYQEALDRAGALVENSSVRPKVALLDYVEKSCITAYGDDSPIGQSLVALGGENAFPEGGYVSVSDLVGGTDIDGMVVISSDDTPAAEKVEMLMSDTDFCKIPALKCGRVVGMSESDTRAGPACLSALETIASVMKVTERAGSYASGPVTVETMDSLKTVTQTYTSVPQRIIVGNDAALEILLYLGLGDRIVGVFCEEHGVPSELEEEYQALRARLPAEHFLSGMMPRGVATLLQPDMIIANRNAFSSNPWALGTTEYFNDLGCNIMTLRTQSSDKSVEGLHKDFDDLGRVFDVTVKTDGFLAQYDYALRSVAGTSKRIAIVTLNDDMSYFNVYGDSSFLGNELNALGGVNVFSGSGVVDHRSILSADVDGVVVVTSDDTPEYSAVWRFVGDEMFADMPAAVNWNVVAINQCGTHGGPSALATVQTLASLM